MIVQSNLAPNLGLRTVPVNGTLIAFDRTGGEVSWYVMAKNQFLFLDSFRELPVVLLTARRQQFKNTELGRRWLPIVSLRSIEKRSGRSVFAQDDPSKAANFYALRFDPQAGVIDFVSPTLKVTHRLASSKWPGGK